MSGDKALKLLEWYVNRYPAFRLMPVGAPHSAKRLEQEADIAAEDEAKALIWGKA